MSLEAPSNTDAEPRLLKVDRHDCDISVPLLERDQRMGAPTVVHAKKIEGRSQDKVDACWKDEGLFPLRIADPEIGGGPARPDALGRGHIVRPFSWGREDPVAAGAEADQRELLGLRRDDPVGGWRDFADDGVVLDAEAQTGGDRRGGVEPPPRPLDRRVDPAQAELPFVFEVPRTEEPALARSPGAGRDRDWTRGRRFVLGHRWSCQGDEGHGHGPHTGHGRSVTKGPGILAQIC